MDSYVWHNTAHFTHFTDVRLSTPSSGQETYMQIDQLQVGTQRRDLQLLSTFASSVQEDPLMALQGQKCMHNIFTLCIYMSRAKCIYIVHMSRCGEDLAELFQMPAIQRFLNGTPSSTLFSHKHIYQPGTLRKVSNYAIPHFLKSSYLHTIMSQVSQTSIQLKDMFVSVRGVGKLTVHQMQLDAKYTLLLMSTPTSSGVYPAEAVIGSLHHELVNVGNSVQFTTCPNEVR